MTPLKFVLNTSSFERKKTTTAFTLVELLITIAIAGLLSAVASYTLKGLKQRVYNSQAKSSIGAVYILEKAFYAECNTYTDRMDALGFDLRGRTFFNVHFDDSPSGVVLPPQAPQGTAACFQTCGSNLVSVTMPCQPNLECAPSAYGYGKAGRGGWGYVTRDTFFVVAHGHFYHGTHFLDVSFGLDETKRLTSEIYPF